MPTVDSIDQTSLTLAHNSEKQMILEMEILNKVCQ